jgi:ABC-type phosphate transport system permease subunit
MSAVSDVDESVRLTVRTLGANNRQLMMRVMHEARYGIFGAIMVGFGRAISEVGAVWMVGGNSKADQGGMHSAPVSPGSQCAAAGRATCAFMPWTALQRGGKPHDGWFVALEYLGNWSLAVEKARQART